MFSVLKEYQELYDGAKMPILGMGTWQSEKGEVGKAVKDCLDLGYRHLDCAAVYENEQEIGEVLKQELAGKIDRKDLWVTSKLWNTKHRPDKVLPALKKTLSDLCLEYLDLYLIHFPVAYKDGNGPLPRESSGRMQFDDEAHFLDTYKELEKVHEMGLAKHIGVSNFNVKQMEELLKHCKVKPFVLQVECHPYLPQNELKALCDKNKIVFMAYSPFGSPGTPYSDPDTPKLLEDEVIGELAKKHSKSVAQILLRYHIDRYNVVIPKSVHKERIQSNMGVFDFKLDKDDMCKISAIERRFRYNTSLRDFYSIHYMHHVSWV